MNYCQTCGYAPQHCRCASNKHLTASNSPKSASNTASNRDEGASNEKPKQRWSREAYNAYMKEYMAKRRITAKQVLSCQTPSVAEDALILAQLSAVSGR